jgi:Rad3-related DNA helicase
VWVEAPATADRPRFSTFPPADAATAAATPVFCVTNAPDRLHELAASCGAAGLDVVPFDELFRLAYPTSAAESMDRMLEELGSGADAAAPAEPSGAAMLWGAWQVVASRLSALPLWALETIELAMREAGDDALARLLGCIAHGVRQTGRNCEAWYRTFPADAGWPTKHDPPAHADCSPLDPGVVASHLLPGGRLADAVPGYEPRPGQIEMLRAVVAAFNAGRHLLVEAGTGVGKTLAYLLPAAHWALLNDVPVIVSTSTRNLQTQLLAKDLPLVASALAAAGAAQPLRTALLKGRSNYLCLRRFGALLEQAQYEFERPDLRQFARAVVWSVQTPDGDLETFSGGVGVDASFGAGLSSPGDECGGRACRNSRRCFLRKARERAQKAHVIVANHALVFAEMGIISPALPPYAQIIFDEAHNLEEAATRHFAVELSPARLATLLRRLSRGHGPRASGALETLRRHVEQGALAPDDATRKVVRRHIRELRIALTGVQSDGQKLFRALHRALPSATEPRRFRGQPAPPGAPTPDPAEACPPALQLATHGAFEEWPAEEGHADVAEARTALRDALRLTAGGLEELAKSLAGDPDDELGLYSDQTADILGSAQALRAFALDMDFVLAGSEATHVFWIQRARGREARLGEAWAAPLSVGERLAEEIYRQKTSAIFCSATLRVGNSFTYMAHRLGVDHLDAERFATCVAASPFDYQRQCAALAATFLPEPGGGGERAYTEQLGALLLELFLATRGRALGLFTSYDMLQQCARMLQHPLEEAGIRLLVQGGSGSRDQITRVFRAGGACVLLGTHSFWEGVDVVGDALSCVVIARLPFAAVNDPVVEARCEQIDAGGGSSFREFAVPAAVIRFRQGFGRLIRHRQDRGVVIVADPRIATRNYGRWFRSSLPCALETADSRDALLARVRQMLGE